MRFMSMVKSTESAWGPPPKALMDAIDALVQEAGKAGCVMVEAGGLLPTAMGSRVRLAQGKLTVTDGPFTEAKEVVGGFAIFEAASKAQMMEWTMRFMDLHTKHMPGWSGECEVRQLAEMGAEPCTEESQTAVA